jgi:2,4-dienoyl-CoA reductase-like NADH-dependent reductase (Old Yellow Enzyme family)
MQPMVHNQAQWSEQAPGDAYLFVEQLAKHAAGLILLTATPEKLGKETPFAQWVPGKKIQTT